jgi:hypothetical protein
MVESFALRKLAGLCLLLLMSCLAPCLLFGEEKVEKAPFNPKNAEDAGLGLPTPYDKFLALDQALTNSKVNWGQVYRKVAVDIDPDAFTDKEVAIPMVLGIRIADGVMAIKALDAEMLNKCAADIEKLAKKLNIADSELGRARAVRAAANKGEWLKVFMELGFFQQDIMKKIEDKEHTNRGTLLIASGWMEGARYTTTVIGENYTPATSNILREPLLAKALKEKMEKLTGNAKNNPAVAKLREVLPKVETILSIPLEGTISKENVAELNRLATEVVKAALEPSSASGATSSAKPTP